jgi:hypothetical protein
VATVLRGQGFFLHQVTTPKQFERAKKMSKIFFARQKKCDGGNEKRKVSVTWKSKEENSLAPKEKRKRKRKRTRVTK